MSSIADYQESKTRAVSIFKNPGDHSTENGVLFTMVAYALNLVPSANRVCCRYFDQQGYLKRYPDSNEYMSWDDHLAACVSSTLMRHVISPRMRKSFFRTPDGKFLGRFPLFVAVALPLPWLAIPSFILDCFFRRSDQGGPGDAESGRQLLWLSSRFLWKHWTMRPAIWIWRKKMMKLYPEGLKSLFGLYYKDPNHPFHTAARDGFK